MHPVVFKDLGLVDFKKTWDYQEALLQQIVAHKKLNREEPIEPTQYLLFCEHPAVFTLGKSGDDSNLLLAEHLLKEKKISYYHINRGGDITFHGPGQIVVYPILDLDWHFNDIHRYLRVLEQIVIDTLKEFGIEGGRVEGLTGVWLSDSKVPRKICAMGVRCSRWVTMHGIALNVNTDLTYYDYIVPCGIQDKGITSIQKEIGKQLDMQHVKEALLKKFEKHFALNLIEKTFA